MAIHTLAILLSVDDIVVLTSPVHLHMAIHTLPLHLVRVPVDDVQGRFQKSHQGRAQVLHKGITPLVFTHTYVQTIIHRHGH